MKIKDLIKELKTLNPNADVVLASDPEYNDIYKSVRVNIFEMEGQDDDQEIELTPDNIKKIKKVIIWGYDRLPY